MSSGPSHWHAHWKDDDGAWRYLVARNFADDRGIIRKPAPDFEPDNLDLAAIEYLCAEWDYGYAG